MKLKSLLFESVDEMEIRNAAWLYMLVYPYKGTMEISSWQNDNRMGVKFIDAMNALSKQGMVDISGVEVRDTNRAPSYLGRIFGKFDNEEDAVEFGKEFKKYDTPKFDISSIPYDIFEIEYEHRVKSNTKPLYSMKYHKLIEVIKQHQRTPRQRFPDEFKQMLGDENLVDLNKKYILYRGLYIRDGSPNIDRVRTLDVGDIIDNSGISWSWSKSSAEGFSKGSTNWMDSIKFRPEKDVAIIIKHEFKHSEILCDLYYIDKQGYDFIDFPGEKEVIVYPKKYKCKIYEIWK